MRLFAAVVPPAGARGELARALAPVRALPGAGRLRWADPAGWHVALAFYGEVGEAVVPALRERLARAARRCPPHRLRLAGGGRFGQRVLWAGVEGETGTLARLAGAAEAAGRRSGAGGGERRGYQPHLTLARARRDGADLAPFATALSGFAGGAWTVAEFRLLHSVPPPADAPPGTRPRYETVGVWPLTG